MLGVVMVGLTLLVSITSLTISTAREQTRQAPHPPQRWQRASSLLDSTPAEIGGLPPHLLTEKVLVQELRVSREELYRYAAGDTEGFLYFLVDQTGMIKIGFSINPARRIATLQTGFPFRLGVLAVVPGTKSMEAFLHYHFAQERTLGEWFEASQRLRAIIDTLALHLADHSPMKTTIKSRTRYQ